MRRRFYHDFFIFYLPLLAITGILGCPVDTVHGAVILSSNMVANCWLVHLVLSILVSDLAEI